MSLSSLVSDARKAYVSGAKPAGDVYEQGGKCCGVGAAYRTREGKPFPPDVWPRGWAANAYGIALRAILAFEVGFGGSEGQEKPDWLGEEPGAAEAFDAGTKLAKEVFK